MKLTLDKGSDTGWISWAHDSAKNAKKVYQCSAS